MTQLVDVIWLPLLAIMEVAQWHMSAMTVVSEMEATHRPQSMGSQLPRPVQLLFL